MSHDVPKGRVASRHKKKYGVVIQHGTQNRSNAGIAGPARGDPGRQVRDD